MNYIMNMNDRAYEIHEWSKRQGFWDHAVVGESRDGYDIENPSIVPEKIALIHTEVSEAMEAFRDDNVHGEHGIGEELADTIIRCLDLAKYLDVNIEQVVANKMSHNMGRPHKHGRKC